MHRRVDPFDRRSLVLSCGVHVVVIALAWASAQYAPTQMEFLTYEIELVSPPPARQAEQPEAATEELVVERPEPDPAPPEPEPEEIVPVQDPKPDPPPVQREDPPAERDPPEAAETTVVAAAEDPVEEEPEESGEGLNVRIEGLRRDYPEYYNNIIYQIRRCFRWRDSGRWETVVRFDIDREGRAQDIVFTTRSGNATFDFEAMGAVECAGRGRFGPLPADLPFDRFPVLFRFQPSNDAIEFLPQTGRPTEVTYE